uniref:Enoyl reductase (ER) domain-containing protein n=1 Tax=Alexandrium monilatum TaxID=311494 RepID=A0A7S4PT64_9DINO
MLLRVLLAAAVTVVGAQAGARMRAAVYTSRTLFSFDVNKVDVVDVNVPRPGDGEVLVEVQASNINPVDHKIVQMAGLLWSYPHKLGFDLAGIVRAVGPGCQRVKVGDEVWGEATTLKEAVLDAGTFAQYAAVSESVLSLKPPRLSMLEAGAMPMVALTGLDALSWAAGGWGFHGENVTVLVLGGSGGTGHLGIQLAKAMGAQRVITTCSGNHTDFVKSLGADQVIDYHKDKFNEVLAAKSVDVVYDCVGLSGTGDQAAAVIKDHGSFATLLQSGLPGIPTRLRRPDISWKAPLCIGACSRHDRLDRISHMVERGSLQVHIDKVFQLEDIRTAFNHSLAGHSTGKVALRIAQGASPVESYV